MTAQLQVRYEPRGSALELFRSREPEVALAGAAGTGKSMACLMRVHLACLNTPGIRCLIVRKTAVSLGSTTLVTFQKKVAAECIELGIIRWFGGSPREAANFTYQNGSTIVVGGLDKPQKVMSSEYDIIFADEATELEEGDWEALGTRLRNNVLPWQQQIAACNPDRPTHWIKQRQASGALKLMESRHEDNPMLFDLAGNLTEPGRNYISKLDALTGVRLQRLRYGRWVSAEGIIYEDWNPSVHMVKPFWPKYDLYTMWWTVDFGFTNPFVLQMWCEDGDGRLFLWKEIYRTKTLVEDHAREVLRYCAPKGKWRVPKPRAIICDHDAEGRETLERHLGLSTIPAKKAVSDGIEAVQARMRPAKDGKPRLFVCHGAAYKIDQELIESKRPTCTAEELPGYIWAVKPGGTLKEEPVKENDHGCDAMRYMCMERDRGGRPRIRFFG